MSRIRADKLVNRVATGAPQLTYGVEIPVGYGITGAGNISITGVITATTLRVGAGITLNSGNLGISGISTFTGGLRASEGGDLVRLRVSGIATFNHIYADGLTVVGVSTFSDQVKVTANTSTDAVKITQSGAGNAFRVDDVTNDVTPFVITGVGTVGIGTTNPQGKLTLRANTSTPAVRITQDGSGLAFRVDDVTNDVTPFVITGIGSVGIGTTRPQGQLHVSSGTSGDCRLILEADTDNNNEADNAFIIFKQDGNLEPAAIWRGNTTGNNNNSLNLANSAGVNGGIRFLTNNDSANYADAVQRMIINPSGSVNITGALSKGSGSFRISHPIVENKYLVHSFIEGPRADLIYRGTVTLSDGTATVNIDEKVGLTTGTWAALCREPQLFLQNNEDWTQVKGSVSAEGVITIVAKTSTSTANIDWLVVAERKDAHMYETEWTDENGRPILEPNE